MDGMTNAQLDTLLETLARLIETKAKSPADAARIVREAKTAESDQKPNDAKAK